MSYCKVAGCRFPKSHTTAGHLCGKCKQYGHGQIECNNPMMKESLKVFFNDKINEDDYCELGGCKYPWSHNRRAHNCHKCFRNHRSTECIIQNLDHFANQFQITPIYTNMINTYLATRPDVFIKYYVGMGCELFLKKKEDTIEALFMHQDSWGQYGPHTSDRPILERFINGLQDNTLEFGDYILDNTPPDDQSISTTEKKCPLCRTEIKETLELKGSKESCSVCLDNDVELYFPNCSHAVICKPCYEKI